MCGKRGGWGGRPSGPTGSRQKRTIFIPRLVGKNKIVQFIEWKMMMMGKFASRRNSGVYNANFLFEYIRIMYVCVLCRCEDCRISFVYCIEFEFLFEYIRIIYVCVHCLLFHLFRIEFEFLLYHFEICLIFQ